MSKGSRIVSEPGREVWIGAGAFALVALALYAWTAAPDLTLVDSGELALACVNAAPAHPPGFPLYVLVGHLFTRLPVASPIRTLNLMSALFAALAVGALFVATERFLVHSRRPRQKGDANDDSARRLALAGASVAAAGFATARNPWTWSAVTEVYAFNLFLVLAAWSFAWMAVVALGSAGEAGGSRRAGIRVTAAFLLGTAGLAVHHATAALILPVLLLMLHRAAPALLRRRRAWLSLAGGLVAVVAAYLWLLPAARRDDGLGWGGIDSLALLVRHVAGSQYRAQLAASEDRPGAVAGEFFSTLAEGCGWPLALLVAGALAAAFLGRGRDRRLRAALAAPLALLGLNLLLSIVYVAGPEDRMAYDLPATAAWCLISGAGAALLLRRVAAGRRVAATLGLVVLVSGWNLWRHHDSCNLRHERTARTFVRETLDGLPGHSLVVTAEWNLYAPYLYMRHVEGYRRDLDVVDVLMMRRFWYFDYLEREFPQLVASSRAEFDAFRKQATRFDLGETYEADRIQGLYEALMLAWVDRGRRRARSLVDWASLESPQESAWIRRRPGRPSGLLVELVTPAASLDAGPVPAMDGENLDYLRRRITTRSLTGDLQDLIPRHLPYWKVWRNYQAAVESSLRVSAGREPAALASRLEEYAAWFPEIEMAKRRALARP